MNTAITPDWNLKKVSFLDRQMENMEVDKRFRNTAKFCNVIAFFLQAHLFVELIDFTYIHKIMLNRSWLISNATNAFV